MRNKNQFTLTLGFLIVAGICGAVASPFVVARPAMQKAEAWDPEGTYFIWGKTPKAFQGFKYIDITTKTYTKSGSLKPVKPYGSVQAGRKYKMTRIDIVGESLSFETEVVAGVSYQFNGRSISAPRPNGPEISGWLMKMVNGKKVAEAQVELNWDDQEGG